MLRFLAGITLLLAIAFVHSAPLATKNNDQSALSSNKDDQSKVLDELKATIEHTDAPKSNDVTTPKPDTDAKEGSAAKAAETSKADGQNAETFEPSSVAMYVFESGDMESVERALKRLVADKKITAEQAAQLQESLLQEVEQMSAASLGVLLEQHRQAEAEAALQDMAEITEQMMSQAELRERLYDRIALLYGKQLILNDDESAAALRNYIAALAEYSGKVDVSENLKADLVEVIEAALRDVKTAAETSELKGDEEELRKLGGAQ